MKPGDRVVVTADWSSFKGSRGTVEQTQPLMVLLEDETKPMRFGAKEVVLEAAVEAAE